MVVDMRKVRGIVLMTAALVAIAGASIAYLRPTPAAAAPVEWTQSQVVHNINLTGRTDGGYFVWARPGGGSGGHAG